MGEFELCAGLVFCSQGRNLGAGAVVERFTTLTTALEAWERAGRRRDWQSLSPLCRSCSPPSASARSRPSTCVRRSARRRGPKKSLSEIAEGHTNIISLVPFRPRPLRWAARRSLLNRVVAGGCDPNGFACKFGDDELKGGKVCDWRFRVLSRPEFSRLCADDAACRGRQGRRQVCGQQQSEGPHIHWMRALYTKRR